MKPLPIIPGVFIVDIGLYIKDHRALILGDFHIGFEDSLIARGVLVPKPQFRVALDRIKFILDLCPGAINTVIINGDLKHEFSMVSRTEMAGAMQVIDTLCEGDRRVIIIKGNHDTIIDPIAARKGIEVVKEARLGRFLVAHGDSIPSVAGIDCLIIGHEHPAICLREGSRVERFKCFLKGRFRGKPLIVMPSFLSATEGTDVTSPGRLSPLLKGDISGFEVFIVEDDVYRFGRIADLTSNISQHWRVLK